MTKNKRYTTDNGSNEDVCLVDNVTGKEFESDFDEIVDLLNEQEEEIQSLKERKESLHKTIASLDECQKGQSHRINQLVKENKQLKQQCLDFMEMLDDMSIAYLLNEELVYILGLTDYDKWVKKQTKRGRNYG